jgi:putative DNA-binding protein
VAYPVVRRLVGDAFFNAAAAAYSLRYPSRGGDLNAFGDEFAEFLGAYAPASSLGYLPDVARLEWAVHECSDAADAPSFDFGALQHVPAECHGGLRLRLHPAARLLASGHPVVAIWEANQPARDGVPTRLDGGDRVLVARLGFDPVPRSLPSADWILLHALGGGCTLDEACAALGGEASRLQELLVAYATEGVVCGFDPPA